MISLKDFLGPNAGYVLELYDRFRQDPSSVDPQTRAVFEQWTPPEEMPPGRRPAGAPAGGADPVKAAGAASLAHAIRTYGHLAAQLDPLGGPPPGDPYLESAQYGLSEADLRVLPVEVVGGPIAARSSDALQAILNLRQVYSTATGYEYGHIRVPEERHWLRKAAELGLFRAPQDPLDEVGLLRRLSQVEAFEGFLHRIFPGQTRFSIEGVDILVPMLDDLLGNAAGAGVCTAVIAMGHRGRLNVLTHILGKPYAAILAEFKDPIRHSSTRAEMGWTGDVKYHKGARRALQAGEDPSGEHVSMIIGLPPNPSHLEHIDPVAVGMARAAGSKVDQPGPPHFFADACLPILIHGDASFPGQGVVAETLNFSRLPGYRVGGAIHIITNNQLGYTAPPEQTRSTLYASDLAKGFQIPVIHTNADDPSACLEAVRTAFAYRQKFRKDFLIDLIGYRRYGHNEGDEPAFTQPQMYQEIERHPSVRKIWANALAERGQVSAQEADRWLQERMGELQAELEKLEPAKADFEPPLEPPPPGAARHVQTAVPLATLRELNADLLRTPQGFTLNRKLERPMQRRRSAFDDPAAPGVDWSTAEQLAFASILADGISIRLTGEDVERGTFSQRHAVFHDAANGQVFIPLQALPQARASFEVRNSALSEDAAIGFEFGYNIQAPQRLVVWEAQYGDFINVAQPMIDEFLLAARAKWEQTPSMVLLLPHAYEGQGPDHSSGRIERFLSLAAGTNLRLANCTTAAQYFHLLRRQAALLETDPLPLIVMTPKSLLRNPLVASPANGLAEGRWQPVIDDPGADPAQVHRLVLCSGKIYVDLAGSPQRADHPEVAIARLEQLYPFPADDLAPLFQRYPRLDEVVWAQEEPENMGAWPFIHPLLVTAINSRWPLEYVGRPANSSPAEGSAAWHAANQKALIARALKAEAAPQPVEAKSAARDSYYAKNKKS